MATRNPSLNIRPDVARTVAGKNATEDALHGPRPSSWWTGKHPTQCPGFDPKDGVLRSLPLPNLSNFTRQSVLDYFDNCWTQTEVLFACLQGTDAFIRQPYHQLRHPMMFYYCHPAVLYINKFRVAGLLEDGLDQFFEQLFETGVDEMSWDDLSHAREDWPPVADVTEYRRKAYQVIRKVIEEHPCLDKKNVGWDDPAWAIFMGFEHERIHIETSSVLIRELPLTSVRKPEYWPEYHPTASQPSPGVPTEGVDYPKNELLEVAGADVALGKAMDYPSFGWDNEYGGKTVSVGDFAASKFKVTNGEFLRFVKAGGYQNNRYWSAEGWGWRTFRNVKWPTFWIPNGPQGLHKYALRALFNAIEMRWDWPVDVNYHEAKAYCAWLSEQDKSPVRYRVITEAEHMLLRSPKDRVDFHLMLGGNGPDAASKSAAAATDADLNPDACLLVSGNDAVAKVGFNIQLAYSSQSPVTELPPSTQGFHDVLGNAWEWGEDHYAAFPGFKVHPYYEDFSSPCFAGKHQLIIGGSFISTGQLASKFARYQFRPHFFQHATFRVVAPRPDLSLYDMTRYGPTNQVVPFMETSCMDCAPPYVGEGPCCSKCRRSAFTPTKDEEAASTAAKNRSTKVLYESDSLLAQVLAAHYGEPHTVFKKLEGEGGMLQASLSFHRRCADDAAAWAVRSGRNTTKALDLGCSVGRGTFELTRHFQEAVGVDLSSRVVEVAGKLKENRKFEYDWRQEGEVTARVAATLDEGVRPEAATFVAGDACALPAEYSGAFDAVLALNLLDRVPDPVRVLQQACDALAPGGVLVITSPFSWSDEYTDRANWLGGVFKDGAPARSEDCLRAVLAGLDLEVLASEDCLPMLIPDHQRKYQLLLTHKLVLKRTK